MKKIMRQILVIVTVFSLIVMGNSKAIAATKITSDDFIVETNNGKETVDFLGQLNEFGYDEGGQIYLYNKKTDDSKKGVVKTARGIYLGSKESTVIKKYGKGKVGKLTKDTAYKNALNLSEDNKDFFKGVKSVRTYKMVKKTDAYEYTSTIHFFIGKGEKVELIGLSRVYKQK